MDTRSPRGERLDRFRLRFSGAFRALLLFLPGMVLVVALHVLFISMEQGRDIVRQTMETPARMGFLAVAMLFLSTVTWYASRLTAFAHFDLVKDHRHIRRTVPRLLGFACSMAVLVAFIRAGSGLDVGDSKGLVLPVIIADLVFFYFLHWVSEGIKRVVGANKRAMLWILIGLHVILWLMVAGMCLEGYSETTSRRWPITMIVAMQVAFTLLVNFRGKWVRALSAREAALRIPERKKGMFDRFFPRQLELPLRDQEEVLPYATERKYYLVFNVISLTVLLFMLCVWLIPAIAPTVGPFAVVWFSAGLLMGVFSFKARLAQILGIPLGLALFLWAILIGFFGDHHAVYTRPAINPAAIRAPFRDHLIGWLDAHVPADSAQRDTVPMIFVLADGGASRSGYWVARVLERLDRRSNAHFRDHLFCLSGASGGAVGIASYYQWAGRMALPDPIGPDSLSPDHPLGKDMLSATAAHMLGPDLLNLALPIFYDRAHALELALERADTNLAVPVKQLFDRARTMHRPILCLNTTRMDDGQPGVVSSVAVKGFTARIDVLEKMSPEEDLALSTAMVLSSRFPYVSPAGYLLLERRKNYFVDGGYFDNSGAGIVQEMLLYLKGLATEPGWKERIARVRPVVVHLANTAPPRKEDFTGLHPLANDLAAPLLTVLGTYSAQTNINDQRLQNYLCEAYGGLAVYLDINLYEQAKKEEFSMSWSVSRSMADRMDAQAMDHPGVNALLGSLRDAREWSWWPEKDETSPPGCSVQ